MTTSKHAMEQRRYRARLKAKAAADAPRGAPETRAVIQSLAVAVRKMAGAAKRKPDSPEAASYQRLMLTAYGVLKKQGFDPAESFERLSLYTLPDEAKARRRRADAERRYWAASEGPSGA
ncbi:hypothetical protein [Aureimonas sp. SK2]|uniref:hypothetical protein n=1 Tax=Aureimonas sp. SK2 TaxID=3015992 RepID=UPI0024445236|nr:hypothetical protein [Aureimonas sp. SK2]